MKKLFTLLTLLVAIVTGAQATGYTPDADEVIILKDVYDNSKTDAGYSKHAAIAWAGTVSSTNSKKAGDPNNNGEATSSNVPCYSVKGNGGGKNITISVTGVSKIIIYHEKHSSRYVEVRDESKTGTLIGNGAANTYFTEVELNHATDYTLFLHGTETGSNDTDFNVYAVKLIKYVAADKPTITAQPKSAEYTTGATATDLTIAATASAGNLSYQWYSNTSASNEGGTAIDGETTTSYTPSTAKAGTYYYYCVATDGNGSTASNVATISVEDLAAPTISVAADKTTAAKNESVTLTATVDGTPEPTIQWYSNTTASNEGGTAIEGATATTYAPSTATPNTYYFYAVATNSQGSATSSVVTLVVNPSNKCQLTEVVYSNSFIAFINEPKAESGTPGEEGYQAAANGTVKAYYMAGTTAPTITSANVSEGATYAESGNTLTVTAEDGHTTAVYDITVEAVTPYEGSGELTFAGTETWVKTGYNFSSDKGWKFAKNADDGRISEGRTRIYFFVGANETVTLTNGLINSERNVKVYVNGTQVTSITKVPKSSASPNSITVPCNTDAANMIAIISNQTGGDGGFSVISTPMPEITLDETGGNTAKISALAGKTANVTVERNLSTSYYNTLFLPFAMTAEQVTTAFGEGAQVATFTGMNSETQFGFGNVTAMEANVPYLVKPTQEVNGFTVEGVTISNTAAAGVVDGGYSMVGNYDTFTNGGSTGGGSIGISIGGSSSSSANEIYYFTTSNTIKKLSSTGSIKGLRAFMVKLPAGKTSVETIVSNAGIQFGGAGGGSARARQDFVLNLDDDNTTTGIEAIENGQLTIDNDAPAYNLAGQKVGKGYKGIVIKNGKKVVK